MPNHKIDRAYLTYGGHRESEENLRFKRKVDRAARALVDMLETEADTQIEIDITPDGTLSVDGQEFADPSDEIQAACQRILSIARDCLPRHRSSSTSPSLRHRTVSQKHLPPSSGSTATTTTSSASAATGSPEQNDDTAAELATAQRKIADLEQTLTQLTERAKDAEALYQTQLQKMGAQTDQQLAAQAAQHAQKLEQLAQQHQDQDDQAATQLAGLKQQMGALEQTLAQAKAAHQAELQKMEAQANQQLTAQATQLNAKNQQDLATATTDFQQKLTQLKQALDAQKQESASAWEKIQQDHTKRLEDLEAQYAQTSKQTQEEFQKRYGQQQTDSDLTLAQQKAEHDAAVAALQKQHAEALAAKAAARAKQRLALKSAIVQRQEELQQLKQEAEALASAVGTLQVHHQRGLEELMAVMNSAAQRKISRLTTTTSSVANTTPALRNAGQVVLQQTVAPMAQNTLSPDEQLAEIRAGNLSVFIAEGHEQVLGLLKERLTQALQQGNAQPEEIYYMATYLAHHTAEGEQLAQLLHPFFVQRAVMGLDGREMILRQTLLKAISSKNLPAAQKLAAALPAMKQIRTLCNEKPEAEPGPLLKWARALFQSKEQQLSFAERQFKQKLTQHLATIASKGELRKPGGGAYTLLEILKENPPYTVDLVNDRAVVTGRNAWPNIKLSKEKEIIQAIRHCTRLNNWTGEDLAGAPADALTPAAPIRLPSDQQIAQAATGNRVEALQRIDGFLIDLVCTATGLKHPGKEETRIRAHQLFQMAMRGELPDVIKGIFGQNDGEVALLFTKLLYYRTALTHRKKGFKEAELSAWNWLITGNTLEKTRRMVLLVQELVRDPNFQGSALAPDQVKWAQQLHDLYVRGRAEPIYAEAGSGKTVTAQFMMRLLARLGLPQKTAHFVSPFACTVEGMQCHQQSYDKDIEIPIADGNFEGHVVLCDEAHRLHPQCKVFLTHGGERREVFPLLMTATPVIPHNNGYRTFKQKRLEGMGAELSALDSTIRHKKAAMRKAAEEAYWEKGLDLYKKFLELVTPFANKNIPRQSQTYGTKLNRGLTALEKAFKTNNIQGIVRQLHPSGSIGGNLVGSLFEKMNEIHDTKPNPTGFKDIYSAFAELSAHFAPNKSQVIEPPVLKAEIEALEKLRAVIAGKVLKGRSVTVSAPTPQENYFQGLAGHRREAIRNAQYAKMKPVSDPKDIGGAVGDFYQPKQFSVQLVFPAYRFTEQNFLPLIRELHGVFATSGKTVRFVYQDSHSNHGDRGKKWVIEISADRTKQSKKPLEDFVPTEESVTVMLYDQTNMQGGDFGAVSRASAKNPVHQLVLCNVRHDPEAASALSENDVYQALRRRRGAAQSPALIVGVQEANEFRAALAREQEKLEQLWKAKYAATKIAGKLLKMHLIAKDPKVAPSLKKNSLHTLQQKFSAQQQKAGYEKVDLIEDLQRWILSQTQELHPLMQIGKASEKDFFNPEGGEHLWHINKKRAEVEQLVNWARS